MGEIDWITDRRPTEADGDEDGDVFVRTRPLRESRAYVHWSLVSAGTPWKPRSPVPEPQHEPPSTTPRKFVAISSCWAEDTHHADAVADDGTAWHFCSDERMWAQYTPLPAREVQADA